MKNFFLIFALLLCQALHSAEKTEKSLIKPPHPLDHLVWEASPSTGNERLAAEIWKNEAGEAVACRTYDYNDSSLLVASTLYGNLSGTCTIALALDEKGEPLDNGIEKYTTSWTYAEENDYIVITQREDNGNFTRSHFDPLIKQLAAEFGGQANAIEYRLFFTYNELGLMQSKILDDGHSLDVADLTGVHERYTHTFVYNADKKIAATEQFYLHLANQSQRFLSRTLYEYDAAGLLLANVTFDADGNALSNLDKDAQKPLNAVPETLLSPTNTRGSPLIIINADSTTSHLEYHLDGSLKKATRADGTYTLNKWDYLGRPLFVETYDAHGQLQSGVIFIYSFFHIKEYSAYDRSIHLRYEYDEKGSVKKIENLALLSETPAPAISTNAPLTAWEYLWLAAYEGPSSLYELLNNAAAYMQEIKEEYSVEAELDKNYDSYIRSHFSDTFLKLAGYEKTDSAIGVFPGKHKQAHIRLTLINGILNTRADIESSLKAFSKAHGDATIHYVFRSSEGWTQDVLNCAWIKLGYISREALLLADLWKMLIEEMGGVDGDGIILHYAHSIGAIDTYMAKELLTPVERQKIHVITIGSPSMLPANTGFGSLINYASLRDPVCMLDPMGFLNGLLEYEENVKFLGTSWGIPEHTLDCPSYSSIINVLGEQFMQAHGIEQ